MLRIALALSLMGLALDPAHAAERVQFESARYQVGPLQRRLALERREPLIPAAAGIVNGFLTKPDGPGPFPAIVHLHGCGGLPKAVKDGAADHVWARRLAGWGYAVLVVDSFTTRHIDNTCSGESAPRVGDAIGAAAYLSQQSFVDPKRIGVIGFSVGGIAALSLAEEHDAELFEGEAERAFRAAVAYYPSCNAGDVFRIPTLILIGELDDWSPVANCRRMMARQNANSSAQMIVYPGAYHAFDVPVPARRYFGHWLEYNAAAAERASEETRRFLAEQLGR